MNTILNAKVTRTDSGGFVAVASTDSVDRDGEVIAPGAFNPLPASLPVHMNHSMNVRDLVARARPYYQGGRLMIEARFASTTAAQEARTLVTEGILDSVSVVFYAAKKEQRAGVPTIVTGELLAVDLVSIPSNRDALVMSSRSYTSDARSIAAQARSVSADALLALARVEIREARRLLAKTGPGPQRQRVDTLIRDTLTDNTSTAATVRHFLRSIEK